MPQTIDTKKELFIVQRGKSFVNAGRGLKLFLKTTPNAWVQISFMIIAVVLGFHFKIGQVDWLMIIFSSGAVLAAEAFNTSLEIDINLTSPNYHPYARDTKDVAAGAVLITSITAAIIGCLVFWPYIIKLY